MQYWVLRCILGTGQLSWNQYNQAAIEAPIGIISSYINYLRVIRVVMRIRDGILDLIELRLTTIIDSDLDIGKDYPARY